MTRDQARSAIRLLVAGGGLVAIGAVVGIPLIVKYLHARSPGPAPILFKGQPARTDDGVEPGTCRFCAAKPTRVSITSILAVNPLWKTHVLLLAISLPLMVLSFYIPTLFHALAHARSEDRFFRFVLVIVFLPLSIACLLGVPASVLRLCYERRCTSCKARWLERYSFSQFLKEITKKEAK
jgi:hypothetical protein